MSDLLTRDVPLWGPIARQVRDIYRRSFPPSEQVPLPLLHLGQFRSRTSFTAWIDPEHPVDEAGEPAVIALTYSSEDPSLIYLAFLAVDDRARSAGYGSRILSWFAKRYPDRPLVLEIELPEDPAAPNPEQRARRLRFYEKNGFAVTNMLTHEAGETYRVLVRGVGAEKVAPAVLEKTLNSMGLGLVRSTVTTD